MPVDSMYDKKNHANKAGVRKVTRLQIIAAMLLKDEPAADIGADHALLSIFLVENNLVPRVIVTELADGPYQRARKVVGQSPFKKRMEVRQGDGLQVLKPGEVSNIIIAGMGGDTITGILAADWEKAASFTRYVFQPMSRAFVLRQALAEQGWPLLEETVVYENHRYFTVLSCCPGHDPYMLSDLELEIGPLLLKGKGCFPPGYLEIFLKKYRKVYQGLKHSPDRHQTAIVDYQRKIMKLEEILYGQG